MTRLTSTVLLWRKKPLCLQNRRARCVLFAMWQATVCWTAAAMSAAEDRTCPCSIPAGMSGYFQVPSSVTYLSNFTNYKYTFLFFLLHYHLINNVLKSRKRKITIFTYQTDWNTIQSVQVLKVPDNQWSTFTQPAVPLLSPMHIKRKTFFKFAWLC